MLSKERQHEIMALLQNKKVIKIKDICEKFDVSNETARRDLEALEQQKLLKRIYGGAVLESNTSREPVYSVRSGLNITEKRAIGKKAAELIKDGSTVFLDVGTTTLEVARNLTARKNITVITNSLPIINELANTGVELLVLGGKLRNRDLSMSGHIPLTALTQIYMDIAIVGAGGITMSEGMSDYNFEEAQVRKLAIERAHSSILVADYSKFGVNALAMVAPVSAVDVVVSDWRLDKKTIAGISEFGIKVMIAPEI